MGEGGKEMANDTAKQIAQMLEEAWNKFFDHYNKSASKYLKLWELNVKELNEKDAKESHWICWNEYDLMFYIGRFFYDILKEKGEEEFKNIEIHFEKNVNFANFKDFKFKGRLDELKKRLKMNRGPKVDLIVAYEYKNDTFLLCAEVKCFHSASEHYGESPTKKISADVEKLKAIRDCGIAQKVVFMFFDDYYWWANKTIADEIEKELDKIKKDEKIKVLSSSSEAKLEKHLK